MVERWFVGDFVTGAPLADLRLNSGRWKRGIADTGLDATLPWGAAARAIADAVRPWSHYLACDRDGVIMAAGPIMSIEYRHGRRQLSLRAAGAEAYFSRREINNPQVVGKGWEMYDHAQRKPAFWAATSMGMDGQGGHTWEGILGWFVKQAMNWPQSANIQGWNSDADGEHGMWIDGIDHRTIREVLDDVQRENGGIEWDVDSVWSAGNVLWDFNVGDPLLTTSRSPSWSDANVVDLTATLDGRDVTTHQHVTGRAEDGTPISVTSAASSYAIMLEDADMSRTTESDRARLQRWANEGRALKARPTLNVPLTVRASDAHLWNVGDYGTLTLPDAPWVDGKQLRVISRSGAYGSDLIDVTCDVLGVV